MYEITNLGLYCNHGGCRMKAPVWGHRMWIWCWWWFGAPGTFPGLYSVGAGVPLCVWSGDALTAPCLPHLTLQRAPCTTVLSHHT